jgi:hypothetical protein
MLRNSAKNLGQEENHIPHHVNTIRQQTRVTIAKDVVLMLVEIAAQNADTTTVNLWIDSLKVSLGSEHTNAVFKCMQEAYLADTKDAYASLTHENRKLESQGHEFHLCQSKPVMITPNKHKVPSIRDDVINFT